MAHSEYIPWRCPNGHIMGRVIRLKHGKKTVSQLEIFRDAVDLHWMVLDGLIPDVLGLAEGFVDVRCSICGKIRAWVADKDAFEDMLKNAGVKAETIRLIMRAIKE